MLKGIFKLNSLKFISGLRQQVQKATTSVLEVLKDGVFIVKERSQRGEVGIYSSRKGEAYGYIFSLPVQRRGQLTLRLHLNI